ncbi:hypothetical protein D9M69_609490 [compost metagenome]
MDNGNIGVPLFNASLGLCFKALENFLRTSIARSRADNANRRARIFLLEQWAEIFVHIIDHVLVACGQNGQFIGCGG